MRTSNPALSDDVFQPDFASPSATTMTLSGAVTKTGILLTVAVVAAAIAWIETTRGGGRVQLYVYGGAIAGFITAFICTLKPSSAPFLAPLYAAFEGLFLGALSAMYESVYNGIVAQAAFCTFGTLGALLLA